MINPSIFFPVKKPFLITFVILIIFSCNEKMKPVSIRHDLFFENLKGDVEKAEEIPYATDSTGKVGPIDSCCISIIEYDDKGYRTKLINKDMQGNEKYGQYYSSRFHNGRVKEIRSTGNGKLINILSGTLDKTGNYGGDTRVYDSSGKMIFFYSEVVVNEYGKIISMKKFSSDSILQQTIINKYDKHISIGGSIKDSSGKDIFSTTIRLNEKNDPAEVTETMVRNEEPLISTTRYVYTIYDEQDNWTECRQTDEKGNTKKILRRIITYRKK